MLVEHLSLTHFRNYRRLELDFTRRLTLIQGRNAQGKTNLLEALYFLATSKPVHAQAEREIVDWQATDEPIPYTRVAATVLDASQRTTDQHPAEQHTAERRTTEIEIILTPRGDGINYNKQIKINGVPRRSLDLIGLMRAVLFLPEDVKLIDGAPGERRRYLDIALCQIDPTYTRALSNYQKVLAQRNSLLKTLRDQGARPTADSTDAQLAYWDESLVRHGSAVMARRHAFVAELDNLAYVRHAELSAAREALTVQYLPSLNYTDLSEGEYDRWQQGWLDLDLADHLPAPPTAERIAERFAATLAERRARELGAGATLYGPHRDDLRFLADRRDLRSYGSRGQQRTAALSLKLAEVQAMTQLTGEAPLLLLDDVMSELDAQRRSTLLAALEGVNQAILTTTDWEDFTPEFRRSAQCLHVSAGVITEPEPAAVGIA